MKNTKTSFLVKSWALQLAAGVVWFCSFMAIRQTFMQPGDDPRLAWVLMVLVSLLFVAYFSSGTRVQVDTSRGTMKKSFLLLGFPLRTRHIELDMQELFLLPERHREFGKEIATNYYHVCLGKYLRGADDETPPWQVVAPDFQSFFLAERRLRKLARALGLPATIYWERLREEFGKEEKSGPDLRTRFTIPKKVQKFYLDETLDHLKHPF